jgi:hypothetical protein
MTDPLRIVSILEPVQGSPGLWSSPALSLPGAKITRVTDDGGADIAGATILQGSVALPQEPAINRVFVAFSVPDGLISKEDVEARKLAFEQDKQAAADGWQRRTFIWTIASALLTLLVTLGGQTVFKGSGAGLGISVDELDTCRNSLKRTVSLSTQTNETVASLATAIRQHDAACDGLLVKLIGKADRGKD